MYAKSDHATPDGLVELLREEDGIIISLYLNETMAPLIPTS